MKTNKSLWIHRIWCLATLNFLNPRSWNYNLWSWSQQSNLVDAIPGYWCCFRFVSSLDEHRIHEFWPKNLKFKGLVWLSKKAVIWLVMPNKCDFSKITTFRHDSQKLLCSFQDQQGSIRFILISQTTSFQQHWFKVGESPGFCENDVLWPHNFSNTHGCF